MIQNKLAFITLILVLLFGMSSHTAPFELQPIYKEVLVNEKAVRPKTIQKVSKTQAYIERGPITITSDFQLNNSGFPGNGTVDDPIRIEGYNITASSGDLIFIQDTTFYFRVENNYLNGLTTADDGISFQNVQHGAIVNNTVTNVLSDGILLESSSNNTIKNNTVANNLDNGVELVSSDYVTIQDNIITSNGATGLILYGFTADSGSHYCLIHANRIVENGLGIEIFDNSNQNVMTDNVILRNQAGIDHWRSSDNLIANNSLHNNADNNIYLGDSDNNTITRNAISLGTRGIGIGEISKNNTISLNLFAWSMHYGLSVDSTCENINVEFNDFTSNNIGGSQAKDDSANASFRNNYWDDWTGFGSYAIEGENEGNEDPSPLLNPYHLSVPIFTAPTTENLTLTGVVSIQWNASMDSFGHTLTYSVLYSTNDGTSWTTLVSDLITTNYTLDTLLIADGPILFKIQTRDEMSFTSRFISEATFLIANDQLSSPTILFPDGGETHNETITIEWSASLDSLNHSITYTIYYSTDSGATWTQIATGITSTSYAWDTTTAPNGFSYLIKVVATCSEGETEEDLSDGLFTIQNVIPTTTTTSETSSTTTPSPIPGMTGLVLLVTMVTLIMMRKGEKK